MNQRLKMFTVYVGFITQYSLSQHAQITERWFHHSHSDECKGTGALGLFHISAGESQGRIYNVMI